MNMYIYIYVYIVYIHKYIYICIYIYSLGLSHGSSDQILHMSHIGDTCRLLNACTCISCINARICT